MNVAELMERLSELPRNLPVKILVQEECRCCVEMESPTEVEIANDNDTRVVLIT